MDDLSDTLKQIQNNFIQYIDSQEDIEAKFQNLIDIIQNKQILKERDSFILVLRLILTISNNHCRSPNFFDKIFNVLTAFKDSIKEYYSNHTIFNIFKSNKRIILFLIESCIISIDEHIAKKMKEYKYYKLKYPHYFFPEIKEFLDEATNKTISKELPDDFEQKRQKDTNDNYLQELIKNDNIDEFITYINKNDISLKTSISPSIFETNSYLISKEKFSLIEFSSFYGSIQIFKYLYKNSVELEPKLWISSIHGNHPEIIHILEDESIKPPNDNYEICLEEAIKCHHNDTINYILSNYINDEKSLSIYSVKYYNFAYIDFNNSQIFYDLCKYYYNSFIKLLIQNKNIDINQYSIKTVNMIEKNTKTFKKTDIFNHQKTLSIYEYIPVDKCTMINEESNQNKRFFNRKRENTKMTIKKTPLHLAVEKENIDLVKLLLNFENIDVNKLTYESLNIKRDPSDWDWCRESLWYDKHGLVTKKTPLYIAIEKENLEIVQLLLENKNIDVNIKSSERKMEREIEESDRKDVTTEKTPLYLAVAKENSKIVQLLLSNKNIDVNIKSMKYGIELWMGFGGGNDDIFIDKTSLHLAVKKENCEIIKLLLGNNSIDTNIKYCSRRTRYDRHGASFDDFEKTTLFMAVEKSNATIVKLLLDNKNIDINAKSLFNSFYINEHSGDQDNIYSYAEKYYQNKWGLKSEINNKVKEEEEEDDDDDEYFEQYDQYCPIDTHYKRPRTFSLSEMTPLQLAQEQNDKDIIALLSK